MGARAVAEPGMIEEAVKYGAGGGGAMAVLLAWVTLLKWFVGWLTGRLDLKQARIDAEDREIDQKWRAYRETIEKDRDALRAEMASMKAAITRTQDEVERCHAEKREISKRLSKIEGFAAGRGEAVQFGQIEQSARRVIDGEEAG